MPWGKYILSLLGFRVRWLRAVDQWEWQDPPS
jgi:hypothetical protein